MTFDPLQLAPLLAAVLGYAWRCRTLEHRGRPVSGAQHAWFALAVVLLLVALVSPVDRLGEERLFYVHMVQHLLLGDLAPLALVLGLSGPLLRPLLAMSPARRMRGLAHPLVALPVWAVNLWLWHLPVLYEGALEHDAIHALEHMLFFGTGTLMWASIVEPLPGPAWFGSGQKAIAVLAARAVSGVLTLVFIFAGRAFYPHYAAGERSWGIASLQDQRIGGLIMFVEGSIVTLAVFAWLFMRWTQEAELGQALVDAGHDPRAASRAARYGRRALDPSRPPGRG